ncbi:TBC1 domain family member 31 isoform 1-T1 [Synchiropus picturatus]
MEVTDIGNKEEGKIWHRKPTPGKRVLARVVRTGQKSRIVRFLHVAFDGNGESFLAGDHHGNMYIFDISRNRFCLVQRTGQPCTALAYNLLRQKEFLVALADNSIKCFDKDTKQMVSWMQGHEGAVSSISIHSSGRSAITTSSDVAQIWDLDTFERKRKLTVKKSVGIQKVFYIPHSNTILSCFSDDSVFAWESDTLTCEYQLPALDCGPRISYRTFAVSQDGKLLAAGGRSYLLHLWCLESKELVKVIQMPDEVRTVKQLEFLPDTFDEAAGQTLGVLSQDGLMRFININSCKLLFHLGSPDLAIISVAVSPNGRHVAAVLDNGSITVYSIHDLTQESIKVAVGTEAQELSKLHAKDKPEVRQRSTKPWGTTSLMTRTNPSAEDKEVTNNVFPTGLDKKRLDALLNEFGEYPAKYRMFLWRSLLCLPENYVAYSTLIDRGLHPAFASLQHRYPIKSQKLQRGLLRVLSALAHWAAIFGEVEYLPLVSFPFVKLFPNNPLLCFEVVATVIVNWCQHWFEYFPNPPLNILSMTENVLAYHDPGLLRHLLKYGISSQLYVWPLLETLFSEVLTRDEWLRLFDNVFSNHPSFLLMACVAYITCCRRPLLLCFQKQDFEYFFHHRNNLDVGAMIKEAHRLMSNTPSDIHPKMMLNDFTPLAHGQYPIFNQYPEFIVEYRSQERNKIQQQEAECFREIQDVSVLRSNFVRRQAEQMAFSSHQELLQKAEEQRRNILAREEEKLSEQMKRLAAMKRELEVEELGLLDPTKRSFQQHQELGGSQMQTVEQEKRRKHLSQQQHTEEDEGLRVRKVGAETSGSREPVQSSNKNMHAREEWQPNACQRSLESEWRGAMAPRLEQSDATRERQVGALAGLHRKTLADQERLAGQKRQEVARARDPVQEQSQPQAPSGTKGLTQQSEVPLHSQLPAVAGAGSPTAGPSTSAGERTKMVCLNSSTSEDSSSSCLSLDRGRTQLDTSERQLLKEIRELRQKLAARARGDSTSSS